MSWNQENHLSSGGFKFGCFVEMLKTEKQFTLFEQVETRLGNNRNDDDIIEKIASLLDGINEETVYNKLKKSWLTIQTFKRDLSKPLNEFFSEFETLQ